VTPVCQSTATEAVKISAGKTPAMRVQNYPWCAIYSDGMVGGITSCGFTTFEQCTQTARGLRGFCRLNPQYQSPSWRGGSKKVFAWQPADRRPGSSSKQT
jgi:hypothetical protein